MTDERLAAIRKRHNVGPALGINVMFCQYCNVTWPCDAAALAERLKECEDKLRQYENR